MARHEAHARAFGIALPPPIHAPGTLTLACADNTLRQHRETWERQPRTLDVIDGVRARIAAERRVDLTVRTAGLSMLDDGRLQVAALPASNALRFEGRGFETLCRLLTAAFHGGAYHGGAYHGGAELLLSLEPRARAQVLNAQLARTRRASGPTQLAAPGGVRVRTGQTGRRRSVYAVVGEATRSLVRRPHRGRCDDIAASVVEALRTTQARIAGFAEDWNLPRQLPAERLLVGGARGHTAEQVLRTVARSGLLAGLRGDAVQRGVVAPWRHERGGSAADVVNAVTRYAHDGGLSREREEDIGRIAGGRVVVPA